MFKSYLLGFILSILLTVAAYLLVVNNMLSQGVLIIVILALAVIQLWVQLIMFLHLGQETGPRWKLISWISTASVLLIVVIGSIVIMNNLNYHVPSDQEIIENEGIHQSH
ncbi:MAG: cytochrome o ubiquinol oxidase subunit IV [Candidatus Doudnabacteria bacterium RIFCSPLOWO2_02_FULL_42_9]|uniref:Cytochrome o ubiquinol oxidase subunit IV n=1 Tax=Candidatus Doudnabacteria bacterium RIFCSPHIGHO2_01_FULL_41_86 TaxID=1817821 RepID=A0A1F5N873_9BACT|nr:MAG: cytochrome o ubiquinol oxidase subunit IV [Candidatus Doudnabacteria bacterium RIFCSPHIGHO2_01_FULL_41_86]OGE75296.1 MAG: cytochrome o ubiquinol oxidase subunit IV [Candidatus Doudnabacteria bacterium RIFCSPHIGHO2_01_43_10]OGE85822.1 MAG: cytochrome o ubiquinol oxidase subunit IV [Candidatus Doudnabacteria bacterium RIFCSPHIGHO2_12_FULL_42_22]OGE87316.1 MAG: cytochrome o ubiquinol oxidase subunit IV [Candidatus Doudnabacteria bacterium RIFCSPHIGHO2_02_FULL_42_25]OGE92154.1 MAG: cytochro